MDVGETLGSAFESFYSKHILRDVFAKMAPGALLLIGVRVAGWSLDKAFQDMGQADLGAWLVFAASAWLAGLAVQGIGELTGLRWRYCPVQYFSRRPLPNTGKLESRNEADSRGLAHFDELDLNPKVTSDQKQRVERFIVIKEAAGNACISLAIVIVTIVVCRRNNLCHLVPSLLVGLAAFVGLWALHINNVRRQDDLLDKIIKDIRKAENK